MDTMDTMNTVNSHRYNTYLNLCNLSQREIISLRDEIKSLNIPTVAEKLAELMSRDIRPWKAGEMFEVPGGHRIHVCVGHDTRKPSTAEGIRQLAESALREAVASAVRRLEARLREVAVEAARNGRYWLRYEIAIRANRLARRGVSADSLDRYEAYLYKGRPADVLDNRNPHDRACRILGALGLEREIQGFLRYREVVVERGDVETPTVDLERHWDKYRTHWYQWVRARVTLPNRRALSQARAAQVGVQGGMLTLLLDEEGRAVWMRRTREGLQIEQGWMLQASNGSWVHASTRDEALQGLERRERAIRRAAEPRRPSKPMDKIQIDLRAAIRAGLCRPGILAWCEEHRVDPAGSMSLKEIVDLDRGNPFIRQLAAAYGYEVAA